MSAWMTVEKGCKVPDAGTPGRGSKAVIRVCNSTDSLACAQRKVRADDPACDRPDCRQVGASQIRQHTMVVDEPELEPVRVENQVI